MIGQPALFEFAEAVIEEPPPRFDGATFDPEKDQARLGKQLGRVREVLMDGQWHTLFEISERAAAPPQSVSARLRDLRKERFGGYVVEGRRRKQGGQHWGTWEYRLVLR